MKDQYPQKFPLEIDHDRLRRYYQKQALHGLGWGLGLCGGLLGLVTGLAQIDEAVAIGALTLTVIIVKYTLIGLACGVGLGLLLYVLYFRWRAKRLASEVRAEVDGPFMVVNAVLPTREMESLKTHFRAIVDFGVLDNKLMRRVGIKSIRLSTTSGRLIEIPAVKDAERVRDLLAEIDAIREV